MAGDGGISMLFGDLMTVVQQELPIKIAVFDNGKLGFVEIEQKAEGMLDTFTKLKNQNFAEVARAIGLWGQTVSKADQLEGAVKVWLSQPGPALLHVHVNPMQLVMPPFATVEPAIGMALYSSAAIVRGRWNFFTGVFGPIVIGNSLLLLAQARGKVKPLEPPVPLTLFPRDEQ